METRLKKGIITVLIGIVLLWTLAPIFWLVSTSFKPLHEIQQDPPVFFSKNPRLRNYKAVFGLVSRAELTELELVSPTHAELGSTVYTVYLRNSLIAAGLTTVIIIPIAILAAYALDRFAIRRKKDIKFWILSQRMIPPIAIIIPLYLLLAKVHLIDTVFGLVIAYSTLTLPFAVWMLTSYFAEVPKELDEAALLDGCSRFQVLTRIIIPLISPCIAAAAILSFMFCWNEFIAALMLTYTDKAQTVAVALSTFKGSKGVAYGQMAALTTISMIPIVVLVLMVQRYLVRGLTFGALK
jgi:multiple sugar transport system permease protein